MPTTDIFTNIYNIVFPVLAEILGYLQAFATMPSIAFQYLFMGGSFEWEVVNFLTGQPFTVEFYSYSTLLYAFRDFPVLGDILGLLNTLLEGLGEVLFRLLFVYGDTYDYLAFPVWISLPLACVRMWFIMTIVKWIMSFFNG